MKIMESDEPQVLTAILEVTQADSGKVSFEWVNGVKATGFVKKQSTENPNFEFRFLDKSGRILAHQQKYIALMPVVEYVDEDGNLAKKALVGRKIIVAIRTNYQAGMTSLQILEMPDLLPLTTISLMEIVQ